MGAMIAMGIVTLGYIVLIESGTSKGAQFTPDMMDAMRKVNKYDRYMGGSGQYDDDPEDDRTKKWRKDIDILCKTLSQEAKDFMNYNHWRTWNA